MLEVLTWGLVGLLAFVTVILLAVIIEKAQFDEAKRGEWKDGRNKAWLRDKSSNDSVRQEFERLAKQWREDTMLCSSTDKLSMHPAYQRIIALGAPALPLVIEELRTKGGHWFWALHFLANHDPVPEDARGNYAKMRQCWLDWWDEKKNHKRGAE